jgi:hypothetical protein
MWVVKYLILAMLFVVSVLLTGHCDEWKSIQLRTNLWTDEQCEHVMSMRKTLVYDKWNKAVEVLEYHANTAYTCLLGNKNKKKEDTSFTHKHVEEEEKKTQ